MSFQRTSSGRVLAPDSSPTSTDKAINTLSGSARLGKTASFGSSFTKNISRASDGSGERPATSLNGGSNRGVNGSSAAASTSTSSSSSSAAPPPPPQRKDGSSSSFDKALLDRYRFKAAEKSSHSVNRRPSPAKTISDNEEASASDASDGAARPQKKRKFKRGKPPSASSTENSPVKAAAPSKPTVPPSPIIVSDSGDEYPPKVKKMHMVFKDHFSIAQCSDEVRRAGGDYAAAMSALSKKQQYLQTRGANGNAGSSKASSRAISVSSSPPPSSAISTPGTSDSIHRMSLHPQTANPDTTRRAFQPPPKPSAAIRREAINVDSESDDDGFGSSEEEEKRISKRDAAAVQFFNQTAEETLPEMIACTAAQARIIVGLRPYSNPDDVARKLRSTKGVTAKLFEDYTEILAAFQTVDAILRKCEDRAARLEKACSPAALAADPDHLKKQPRGMGAGVVLKDYQLDGVNWMSLRYRNQTSCILADDMGTGKTCQVIAFLCDLKNRGVKGTNLVVAPSSTIENWSRELDKFAPNLEYIVFAGDQAERRELRHSIEDDHDSLDVIVVSYNNATSAGDAKFFKKFGFNACVYDEGHQLKNQNTNNYRSLTQVRAKWRLLLTGTPLQNNLLELMSLLKFIMPNDFRNATEALETIFKSKGSAKDSQLSKSRVDRAKKMMGPFVLRRLKDKVLSLPPKTIRVEYCDMTSHQQKLYNKVLARTKVELLAQEEEGGGGANKAAARKKKDKSSNILMRLRKAAIHPLLFRTIYTAEKISALVRDYVKEPQFMDANMQHLREDFAINSDSELSQLAGSYPLTKKHQVDPSAWLNSGKITALSRLIEEARSRGEKLVIFSQFEMALFLLMSALDVLKITWIAFSGRTKVEERQSVIDEFQTNPGITVFLLTTKAGGVGVNLTAANWVVMMDQDFNPQNDKQAEDRCWRIGQEKEVHVIKLISRGTIDEDILAMGERKLELAARVSGAAGHKRRRSSLGGSAAASAASASTPATTTATTTTQSTTTTSSGTSTPGEGGGGEDEASSSDEAIDDDAQQANVTQSLMDKLRSRAATGRRQEKDGQRSKDEEGDEEDGDGDGDDVILLD